MGTFGVDAVDVTQPGFDRRGNPIFGIPNDGRLAINLCLNGLFSAIDIRAGSTSERPRGAVLYFPPGRYRISREPPTGEMRPDVTFPPNFTLRFAAGARLELDDEVVVSILGDLEAPLSEIFLLRSRSRVVFGSTNVTQIHPEWWGAVAGDAASDSSNALQACLDAAIFRFNSNASHTDLLSPIRILLGGPYFLRRGIVLGRREQVLSAVPVVPSLGVELVARQIYQNVTSARATFVATGTGWGTREAMLRFGEGGTTEGLAGATVLGVLVQGVSFHANGLADGCVWIPTGGSKFNRFEGCAFHGARRWQMLVGQPAIFEARPQGMPPTQYATTNNGVDLMQLLVTDCSFRTQPNAGRTLAVAVFFRALNTTPMELRSCSFDGPAAAMIVGHSGTCRVRACVFHNTAFAAHSSWPMADAADYPSTYRDFNLPTSGTDLYIAQPTNRRNPKNPNGQAIEPASPTGFFVDHCLSRSAQFLGTFTANLAFERRTDFYPTMIRAMRHVPSTPARTAAILWDGPGAFLEGCSLAMLGCYLGTPLQPARVEDGSVVLRGRTRTFLEISSRRAGQNQSTAVVRGGALAPGSENGFPVLRLVRRPGG